MTADDEVENGRLAEKCRIRKLTKRSRRVFPRAIHRLGLLASTIIARGSNQTRPNRERSRQRAGNVQLHLSRDKARPGLRTPLANNESDDHSTDGTQDKDWCVGFGDDGVWQA